MDNKQYVGSVRWPFFRYDVLMPPQNENDMFEWLYLSIIVNQNEINKKDTFSYDDTETQSAMKLIKNKFSKVIDDEIFSKIKKKTEEDFVKNNRLTYETTSFLSTFESLFSNDLEVYHVFQDGVTGDVLPNFSDLDYIKDSAENSVIQIEDSNPNQPTVSQIRKAIHRYNRLKEETIPEEIIEETEAIIDPDEEVDFEPESSFEGSGNSNLGVTTQKRSHNFRVIYLDGTKTKYSVLVNLFVENNEINVEPPFNDELSRCWMTRRMKNAIQSGKSRTLCDYYNELCRKYTVQKSDPDVTYWQYTKLDIASQLKYFGPCMRLIAIIKNDDLKKLLIKLDDYLVAKSEPYYNTIGQYIECLVAPLVVSSHNTRRESYTFEDYCLELTSVCKLIGINERPLISNNIFNSWKNGWKNLKADLAEILMSNDRITKNTQYYQRFLNDIFDLYNKRSQGSHYNKNSSLMFDPNDAKTLFEVTKVIIELYEVK